MSRPVAGEHFVLVYVDRATRRPTAIPAAVRRALVELEAPER